MSNDNEELCKTWTGIDLSLEKWYEEIGEYWHEHLKSVSKFVLWWDTYVQVSEERVKKLQRSNMSGHWNVMSNLKKNLLVVAKMAWGIC